MHSPAETCFLVVIPDLHRNRLQKSTYIGSWTVSFYLTTARECTRDVSCGPAFHHTKMLNIMATALKVESEKSGGMTEGLQRYYLLRLL